MHLADPDQMSKAAEWQAAKAEIAAIIERMAQHGYLSVAVDEHQHAHQRYGEASDALEIPAHLLVYAANDWVSPYSARSYENMGKSEAYRKACDLWGVDRRLARDDFLELQDRQLKLQEARDADTRSTEE